MAEASVERLLRVIDRSGAAPRIEALLPVGARKRQLSARTLLLGMTLAARTGRPGHLSRVHEALLALEGPDQRRLGVIAAWKNEEHTLTYRQVERTFGLIAQALSEPMPDGRPSEALQEALERLLEASVREAGGPGSSSYAVDWTDLESFSRPPKRDGTGPADPEAAWGRRRGPGGDEPFFGYYLQVATMVEDEAGGAVPELVRRIGVAGCDHDPPQEMAQILERMAASGVAVGDVLADSGYAYRKPETWALRVRRLGAELVQDLHPNDRGVQGTHMGAIKAGGSLFCPATPEPLLELSPLARGASEAETEAHDRKADEAERYRLSPVTSRDGDGYRRLACPAVKAKLRCPLRVESMKLPYNRPQVEEAPDPLPPCCIQKTITVPAAVNAKTVQKHPYPSPSHRRSYARRSGAERAYASVKDPASNDINRGWCRLGGVAATGLFAASLFVARNLRIADSFAGRLAAAGAGKKPARRRRRRQGTGDLIAVANAPP